MLNPQLKSDFKMDGENEKNIKTYEIRAGDFEGPLDLLCYLIEKNKVNIYDIPIVTITDQYLDYLTKMTDYDMEIISSFIVMASTLVHIKSRMLLPSSKVVDEDSWDDPREELVIKLLEYRRCKALAEDLKNRYEIYRECIYKTPEPPKNLGIDSTSVNEDFSVEEFYKACKAVTQRNRSRFNDVTGKLVQILRREKISVKDKMKAIWHEIVSKTRIFFNEIFPADKSSKPERVVGFLALLELLKINKIMVRQKKPFDAMLIEINKKSDDADEKNLGNRFSKEVMEEVTYK